jgi:hypothetical protein
MIAAEKYFIHLMKNFCVPLSPVVVGHNIVMKYGINAEFEYWATYCDSEIANCDEVHVLTIDGWKESTGVQAELKFAKQMGKPILYIPTYTFEHLLPKLTKEVVEQLDEKSSK